MQCMDVDIPVAIATLWATACYQFGKCLEKIAHRLPGGAGDKEMRCGVNPGWAMLEAGPGTSFAWSKRGLAKQVAKACDVAGRDISPPDQSPEGLVLGVRRVLGLFEAQLWLEYQIYCDSEKKERRIPLEYDAWCVAKKVPAPFVDSVQISEADIMMLTAGGGYYNCPLFAQAAKIDPVCIANYLLLDRAGFVTKSVR